MVYRIFFVLLLLTACFFDGGGQTIVSGNQISRRCSGVSPSPLKSIVQTESDGDLLLQSCSGKSIRLFDPAFVPSFAGTTLFGFGSLSTLTIPTADHFTAAETTFPLSISGSGKFYIGQRTGMTLVGTATGPNILGRWNTLSTNSLFLPSGGTIYGDYNSVDIGSPFTNAYGSFVTVESGGSGASGAGTLTALLANVGVAHNGNTTAAYAGDFWVNSSSSSPLSVVTTAAAVRARVRMNSGVKATSLRGIQLTDWTTNGGTADASYGIYADTSIDAISTGPKFFIYSLSTSPSRLSGDVYVSDSTKGIILKSPGGTCYRFTVANGGSLNAGATVTCPD